MLKIIIISLYTSVFAGEGDHSNHAYKKVPAQEKHEEHDDHKDEHANEMSENGFKLNDQSIKTFGLSYLSYKGAGTIVSKEAIFKGLNEVNLYRLREGFFKRIDFKAISQTKDTYTVSSHDLQSGDQIVVKGIGFLRIAEIAASGGLSDSHSH